MREEGIGPVPVVDDGRRLQGLLTKLDLVDHLTKTLGGDVACS